MRLISADRLRSFVGPEDDKKISARKLAKRIGKHPSFVDHLLNGRCRSCKPATAADIAEVLDVPLSILFHDVESSNTGRTSSVAGRAA